MVDAGGNPKLSKKDALATVKVLRPRISTDTKVLFSSFKNGRDCVKWLGDIKRRTTWHEELVALFSELNDEAYEALEVDDEVEGTPEEQRADNGAESAAD